MKKSLLFQETAKQHMQLFKCPVCGESLKQIEATLICEAGHSFDIAKKGYANFVLNGKAASYDKALFAKRKETARAGFFEPLNNAVMEVIRVHKKGGYILDAGCGEGSFLNRIVRQQTDFFGVGIDIAKEGIMQTEPTAQSIFLVGDLAKLPIQSNSIDVILNILTPAHYAEFARVLNDGIVIKVIPNEGYLQELRKICYADSDKQSYSNHQTVQHFYKHFQSVEEIDCCYPFSVTPETLDHILHMTPLTWNLSHESDALLVQKIASITCDFKLLVGFQKIL